MKLDLFRDPSNDSCTAGALHLGSSPSVFCNTLEGVVRPPSLPDPAAIPVGSYQVKLVGSRKFKRILPRLEDVPYFVGVFIHPFALDMDFNGSILVGIHSTAKCKLDYSQVIFNVLFSRLESAISQQEEIFLTIHSPSSPHPKR